MRKHWVARVVVAIVCLCAPTPVRADSTLATAELGRAAFLRGNYLEAQSIFDPILRDLSRRLEADLRYVDVVFAVAELDVARGDFEGALERYASVERALLAHEPDLSLRQQEQLAESALQMALIHKFAANKKQWGFWRYTPKEALRHFDEARARFIAILQRHPTNARAAIGLGVLVGQEMAKRERARTALEAALREREVISGPDDIRGEILEELAFLHVFDDDNAKANDTIERAFAERAAVLGPSNPRLLPLASKGLWTAARVGGSRAAMVRFAKRALATGDAALLAGLRLRGSTASQRESLRLFKGSLESVLTLALEEGDDPEFLTLAAEAAIRRKGMVLDVDAAAMRVARASATPGSRAALARLADARSALSHKIMARPEGDRKADDYVRGLAKLEDDVARAEAEILARHGARVELVVPTLASLRARLGQDAVLVEFLRFKPTTFASGDPYDDRYLAFLVTPQSIVLEDLGWARDVDAVVGEFRNAVIAKDARISDAVSRNLYDGLFGPFSGELAAAKILYVVPDGTLTLIPMEATRAPAGKYLIDTHEIRYLTTSRELIRAPSVRSKSGPVVFAAPTYQAGAPTKCASERTIQGALALESFDRAFFCPLPGTTAEGRSIARLADFKLVVAGDATERALRALSGPSVLHIATHGFFLGGQEAGLGRGLALETHARARRPPPVPWRRTDVTFEIFPLLRAGIAMAGANERMGAGRDDGLLTGLEAASLDLTGTHLVVLSACETGLGDITNGDSIYGLRRSFSIAGAESVVMSLWKVDDAATERLMTRFYENLAKGVGTALALQNAQLALRKDPATQHPFYWAAFVHSGDWRSLPERGGGLSKTPPPPPPVEPGPRGCACGVERRSSMGMVPAAALVGLLGLLGLRSRARTTSPPPRSSDTSSARDSGSTLR